ncbi:MAG: hypothetical protein GF416_07570 [Candidatus Altiarchaeales archaeon]|nr:hypothetical protein [Candidatus Altiarchaeales archaeon]MBD3416970.1 hypothetical protein [Candidatus Altiarchaeales archaeon]
MEFAGYAIIAAFMAASLMLVRSGYERYLGLVFIIRSSHGIRVIDSIAKFKPRFWQFLADFSVFISFGGMGAYYLSLRTETKKNLPRSVLLGGVLFAAVALFLQNPEYAFASLVLASAMAFFLPRIDSPWLTFASTVVLFYVSSTMVLGKLASVLIGVFGLPSLMVYLMASHGMEIMFGKTDLPGVSPLMPSSRGGNVGVSFPGYDLFIPWWYAIIALAVTLVSHEASHGILTRVAGVRLKSTGLLSVLALPIGAFVEPDEEELERKTTVDRMRVFTMGSFANLVAGSSAVVLIIALTTLFAGVVYSDGMQVIGLIEGYPADGVIPEGSVIYSVNGFPTTDLDLFRNSTANLEPGDTAVVNASTGVYELTLAHNPEEPGRGYLGVYILENMRVSGKAGVFLSIPVMSFIINTLVWIAFFNVNIALVNLLPVIPFDGGRMLKEFVSTLRVSQVSIDRVLYTMVGLMILLLLVNVIPLVKMTYYFFTGLF